MKNIKNSKKNSFLKRIFIKIFRKFGFEIIDQNTFEIITLDKKINEEISTIGKSSISLPLGLVKITRPVKALDIIIRTCASINMLTQNKKRLFEKEKKEYTLRSLNSICNNIINLKKEIKDFNILLKIIDDNSHESVTNQIKKICTDKNINFKISNLDSNKYENKMNFNDNKRMLAHNSHIFESKNFAINSDFDLIYFVEDDYLHDDDALIEMIFSYQRISSQLNDEIVLCPADYPYLYVNTEHTQNLIGYKKHWRKINQSLCTYLISKMTLKKYWKYYEDMFLNNYDPYEMPLHELYKNINCFSPMPSLSIHLTNINSIYGLSPLKDWLSIWEKNKY